MYMYAAIGLLVITVIALVFLLLTTKPINRVDNNVAPVVDKVVESVNDTPDEKSSVDNTVDEKKVVDNKVLNGLIKFVSDINSDPTTIVTPTYGLNYVIEHEKYSVLDGDTFVINLKISPFLSGGKVSDNFVKKMLVKEGKSMRSAACTMIDIAHRMYDVDIKSQILVLNTSTGNTIKSNVYTKDGCIKNNI